MNRRQTYATLYVPTLLDSEGARHIIPRRDAPAYCGATGIQHEPHPWPRQELCPRCAQKYIKLLMDG